MIESTIKEKTPAPETTPETIPKIGTRTQDKEAIQETEIILKTEIAPEEEATHETDNNHQ